MTGGSGFSDPSRKGRSLPEVQNEGMLGLVMSIHLRSHIIIHIMHNCGLITGLLI